MSEQWAPPTGPPITSKRLDPKMAMASVGAVAALVIGVVVAMNVGGGDGDTNGSSGRQYLLGVPELENLGKAPTEEPSRQWEYDGDTAEVVDVALGGKSLFVLAEGPEGRCVLRALSIDDGKERWTFALTDQGGSCGSVAVSEDRVLASVGSEGDLHTVALTADKGKEQGRSTIRNARASGSLLRIDPDKVHAYVVAAVEDGPFRIVRLDVADARRSWAVDYEAAKSGRDGLVVSRNNQVSLVDYDTGDALWEVDAGFGFPVGDIVITTDQRSLAAYGFDGKELWQIESASAADLSNGDEAWAAVLIGRSGRDTVLRSPDDGEAIASGADFGYLLATDGKAAIFAEAEALHRVELDDDKLIEQHTVAHRWVPFPKRNAIVIHQEGGVLAIDPESFEQIWEIDEDLDVWAVDDEAMVTVDDEKVTYWR